MAVRMVSADPTVRRRMDRLIGDTLDTLGVSYEHVAEGVFLARLPGEHKLATMTWLVVGEHSLLVEAFVMRRPAENEGRTYGFLLSRNARTYGVHFSVDRLGDVYLTGRAPLASVDAEELDRLLGCVQSYADETFDPALQLGFAGAIHRERAWRARLAAGGDVAGGDVASGDVAGGDVAEAETPGSAEATGPPAEATGPPAGAMGFGAWR